MGELWLCALWHCAPTATVSRRRTDSVSDGARNSRGKFFVCPRMSAFPGLKQKNRGPRHQNLSRGRKSLPLREIH